jgi:RimJ/RimL family protein N-acetyltransferase
MIKGGKVIIREKRMSDAADDYSWRSDSELARLDAAMTLKIPYKHFLTSYTDEISRSSSRRQRFAIDTLDGKHIGNCMYYNIDRLRGEAELGIMIGDRDYWSKGYGTDAVTALLGHIFNTMDIERVYLNTLEWNIRAQRCFEKCGFIPCRRRRRFNGTFVVMEMYRHLWLKHLSRTDEVMVNEKREG